MVGFDDEAVGQRRAVRDGDEAAEAAVQLEPVVAAEAAEVVVVAAAGRLVVGLLAGEVDGDDVLRGEEQLDRPVDGRQAEARRLPAGPGVDLRDGEGAGRLADGIENGVSLVRPALHRGSVPSRRGRSLRRADLSGGISIPASPGLDTSGV